MASTTITKLSKNKILKARAGIKALRQSHRWHLGTARTGRHQRMITP